MDYFYQLVPVAEIPAYEADGWERAGQDPRYPSHCWMRRPERGAAGRGTLTDRAGGAIVPVMGFAPIPSSVPDDRLGQVETRYVQPDPTVEGYEEFFYADTGEVIPPDDVEDVP